MPTPRISARYLGDTPIVSNKNIKIIKTQPHRHPFTGENFNDIMGIDSTRMKEGTWTILRKQ
jgi:hypothetical protein